MATKKKSAKKKTVSKKKRKYVRNKIPKAAQRIIDNTFGHAKTYNLDQVMELAKIQCTNEEISAVLNMHLSTFVKYMKNDEQLRTVVELGREFGKASLRRTQFRAAKNGNTAMMIHLGKNYLGQSEKVDSTVNMKIQRPIINLTITQQTDPSLIKIQEENLKLVTGTDEVVK